MWAVGAAGVAQQSSAATAASGQKGSRDVVVEGRRLPPDAVSAIKPPAGVSTTRYRRLYEQSERMADCALRGRLSDYDLLRAVVDGAVNSAPQIFAQDRLKRLNMTCGEGASAMTSNGGEPDARAAMSVLSSDLPSFTPSHDPTPLGRSIYDRGAYTVAILRRFAPDLSLTRAETEDRAVQVRFNTREIPRNRFRSPVDRRYFEVAVCMVRLAPELSVRLASGEGGTDHAMSQAALIDRARPCVGGARKVRVEPTQFRLYIADAVYRWAVAARGVDSLIPLHPTESPARSE